MLNDVKNLEETIGFDSYCKMNAIMRDIETLTTAVWLIKLYGDKEK